jgi:hypothetical protein
MAEFLAGFTVIGCILGIVLGTTQCAEYNRMERAKFCVENKISTEDCTKYFEGK